MWLRAMSQSDGDVAAVGFEQEVDAVRIALHLPGPAETDGKNRLFSILARLEGCVFS